jgi:hypothetical protein
MAPNLFQADGCWETRVGSEFYRLIVVDTLINMMASLFYDSARFMVWQYGGTGTGVYHPIGLPNRNQPVGALCQPINRLVGQPQFFLTSSLLSALYRQAREPTIYLYES